MSETLHSWLLHLVGAAFLMATAEAITPQGLPKKVGRMVGGLILMLVLFQPVVSLDGEQLTAFLTTESQEEALWNGNLEAYQEELLSSIITDSCEAYIEAQAEELGAVVSVTVICRWSETGEVPVPEEVTIQGSLSADQRRQLEEVISSGFSIPAERQHYDEEQTEEEGA